MATADSTEPVLPANIKLLYFDPFRKSWPTSVLNSEETQGSSHSSLQLTDCFIWSRFSIDLRTKDRFVY